MQCYLALHRCGRLYGPASDVPDELCLFLYDGGKPSGDIPSIEKLSSPFPAKNLVFINEK